MIPRCKVSYSSLPSISFQPDTSRPLLQTSAKMPTTKQDESAHDAARDAALLKKLKGYLQSDDIYKKVCGLTDTRTKLKHRTSHNHQNRDIQLTRNALTSMSPINTFPAGSQKPSLYQQRVASTETASSSGDFQCKRNT